MVACLFALWILVHWLQIVARILVHWLLFDARILVHWLLLVARILVHWLLLVARILVHWLQLIARILCICCSLLQVYWCIGFSLSQVYWCIGCSLSQEYWCISCMLVTIFCQRVCLMSTNLAFHRVDICIHSCVGWTDIITSTWRVYWERHIIMYDSIIGLRNMRRRPVCVYKRLGYVCTKHSVITCKGYWRVHYGILCHIDRYNMHVWECSMYKRWSNMSGQLGVFLRIGYHVQEVVIYRGICPSYYDALWHTRWIVYYAFCAFYY